MQTLHPVMQTALRGFCAPVCNPHADAERWEAEQEAQAELDEALQAARRVDLACGFLNALANDAPLPVGAVGADLESTVAEHSALLVPLLKWAAKRHMANPELYALVQPLADAWALEVDGCAR